MRDTIFALASASGRAAVAVIRVSGPRSREICEHLCGSQPAPRRATLRDILDPRGELIDRGLVLWFSGPHSFTGEDVFELQLHGGGAVVEAATHALVFYGARIAEPGEFTRRAFEAGRLDLSQAEAIADLIDAETAAQRRQALAQLDGGLTRRGERWRGALLDVLARLEAQIDFPDEDIPLAVGAEARQLLLWLCAEFDSALEDLRGERVRSGLKIALIGSPNAGKSSLFNAILARDAAIVAATPGTTRDVIEADLNLGGYKAVIADTAGLRSTGDEIEREGVRRALAWAHQADLRLWVFDSTLRVEVDSDLIRPGDFLVAAKADLSPRGSPPPFGPSHIQLETSVADPVSLDTLLTALKVWAASVMAGAEFPAVTRLRHRQALLDARDHLVRALDPGAGSPELMAEDVRLAARAVARLAGRVDTEAVLDTVFASFCIGK